MKWLLLILLVACAEEGKKNCEELTIVKVGGCNSQGWCGVLVIGGGEFFQTEAYKPVEGGTVRVCK